MAPQIRDKAGRFTAGGSRGTRPPQAAPARAHTAASPAVAPARVAPLAKGEAKRLTAVMETALRLPTSLAERRVAKQAREQMEKRFGQIAWDA